MQFWVNAVENKIHIFTQYMKLKSHIEDEQKLSYTTGFEFMANKQFRMGGKKLGTSVCADILHYALKNQYVQFL